MGERGPWGHPDQNPNNDQRSQTVKKKIFGNTYKVVGSLRDSVSHEAVSFVNVSVLERADSTFVKGASSNYDGYFEVTGVPAGEYLLRVSAIGYHNYYIPFTVENNTALGVLNLKPGSTTLQEVHITAERPLYAMDGEKMIYNVSDDASIQTGTTEDALQNAPGVEVDVEGNITLRGVSSVEIWVNDKPSKLTEENLKTYLQTLPANALARIETITNPSAKYATDAEAVINIVTSAHIKSNQFISFGVNGSNQPFVSPWVSYMWAKEKLSINLFASGRYSYRDNTNEGWSMRRQDNPSGGFDTTFYQTDTSASDNRSYSGNVSMNINYELSPSSELSINGGGFLNYNKVTNSRATEQYYYQSSLDTMIYNIGDTTTSPSGFGHLGVDYTKKFDNEGHNLRVGVNSRFSRNASDEYYSRHYTLYTMPATGEERFLMTRGYNYGLSLDARYNRPYSKDGELSYGLRADHQETDNDYKRYNDHDRSVADTLRTYHFDGQETSVSVDVNWTHRWGNFTFSSGLGYELGRTWFNYSNNPRPDDSTFLTHSLRPSVHLTYRTDNMHNFKLNYSLRMRHPGEEDVSSFRRYGEDSYSTGNSDLKPSYTHSLEAGWQKFYETFGNVGIEGYGRLSTNEISSLTEAEYDDLLDRIVSYSMPYNMGTSWRYGASLNMTYRPSGFFNVRLYANVYDYGYRMEYDRTDDFGAVTHRVDERDKWSWSVRVNSWAKLFDKYQLTFSARYNSPTISLMSERKARYSLDMGVRSDFFKRKMSVFVNVQDIFNWGARYGSGSENTNPYYLSENTNKMVNSRYVSVGITFRFGKLELERSAKDGSSESGDSLDN